MNYTKKDWIEAGNGDKSLDLDKIEKDLGQKVEAYQCGYWEIFCTTVYQSITGKTLPDCSLKGRGSRSRWYAEQVSKVYPIDPLDATKYACPVCGSALKHTRIDDGIIEHIIQPDGSVENPVNKSDGSIIVQCIQDSKHKIPDELAEKILDLVWNTILSPNNKENQ